MLLGDPVHNDFHEYIKALNHLYLSNPAFYEEDYDSHGFEWADCAQEQRLIYSIIRRSSEETILAVFNLGAGYQGGYSVKLDEVKQADLIFSTESGAGEGYSLSGGYLTVSLPPYSGVVYKLS